MPNKTLKLMSSFLSATKSHRKGGPRLLFGRTHPAATKPSNKTSKTKRGKAAGNEKGGEKGSDWLVSGSETCNKSSTNVTSAKAEQAADAWVHRRDIDECRLRDYATIKRKLKSSAYSNHGIDYKHLFQVYDENNDGRLGLDEFRHALRVDGKVKMSRKGGLSDHAIERVFRAIDRDNSGVIEYEEFVAWLDSNDTRPSSSSAVYAAYAKSSKLSQESTKRQTMGQLETEVKKLEAANRFRRSTVLENQRASMVEKWWCDLYGSKLKAQAIHKAQARKNSKCKPSIVGGLKNDPVFTRLYPFKFSETSARKPTTVRESAGKTGTARIKKKEGMRKNWRRNMQSKSKGLWNTNTLVVKTRVDSRRRFSVIH